MNIKRKIKKFINKFGYEIFKLGYVDNESYSLITTQSTYSPWMNNKEFLTAYNLIKNYTLVDIYRCYELWSIVSQLKDYEGDILEVGVWKGGTAGLIGLALKIFGINKNLYIADTFSGVVKSSYRDNYYKGGEHSDATVDEVNKFLKNDLKLNSYQVLKGIFPEDSSNIIDKNRFCLCHIDVDTHDSAKDIFNWIFKRTVKNGIIIFDDYGFYECYGITKLVNELIKSNNNLFIHNLNGHGIFVKLN